MTGERVTGERMTRAILLVDHGSRRPAANELLEEVARRVRARDPDSLVLTAHLEIEQPDIPAGIRACAEAGASKVVVHPYFLGPGRHTTQDIPRIVEAARAEHPSLDIRISEPLGAHEKLVDVILERVEKAGS